MPEETQATAETEQVSTTETTAAESQTANESGQAQTEEQSKTTDAAKTANEGAADAGEKGKSETKGQKQESKPLSRRSAQYRINQLLDENKALKQGKEGTAAAEGEGQPAEETKPDINKLIQEEVERRLNPVLSESSTRADEAELNELFSGDKASDRAKYDSKIREMWKLPQYKDVAASDLYKIVSFDDAVKAATANAIEEHKKAETEAKGSSSSGTSNNTNRSGKVSKSAADMSPAELQAHNDRIKAGLKP